MFMDLERLAAQREAPPAVVRAAEPMCGTVLVRVFRQDGPTDERPRLVTYRVPITRGMTVLDALIWIKEHVDPGLAFRNSCRMGICGSCGMLINGELRLACETPIASLGAAEVEVVPLPHFPIIRDLVTDFTDFFAHHRTIRPHLVRPQDDPAAPVERELPQTEDERLVYYQFTMCIMCGLCDAACPVVVLDHEFLGPQALAQAYRFAADSRDQGWPERSTIVDTVHGCWRCELAGSCSAICPKGVDPALGVQLLKRAVLRRGVRRP